MENFNELSWITSDGFIFRQIIDIKTCKLIFENNLFELYIVNISQENERLVTTAQDIFDCFNTENSEEIICIEIGQIEKVTYNLYKLKK